MYKERYAWNKELVYVRNVWKLFSTYCKWQKPSGQKSPMGFCHLQ